MNKKTYTAPAALTLAFVTGPLLETSPGLPQVGENPADGIDSDQLSRGSVWSSEQWAADE